MPLRAVIFDYGMVLTGPANALAHQCMLDLTQLDHITFETNYWLHRHDYDLGTLNGLTYWQAFARTSGAQLSDAAIHALIAQDMLHWSDLNPQMLRWAAALQAAGLRTAILSNMGADLLAHMRAHFDWLLGFDQLTWSCELHLAKPQPEIYLHTLTQLGVRAEEALFLDDREENVEGARAVGLHALVFRNVEQLRDDLTRTGLAQQLPAL
jgi:putative hydrolase of the HAD superfamily